MGQAVRKTKTAEQARESLMRLCARGERSTGDVIRLLRQWGVDSAEHTKILNQLLAERYVDDERFATAFVRDKMRFSSWGVYKIKMALRAKGVSGEIISSVIDAECGEDMYERLKELLSKRKKSIKAKSAYDLRGKLFRYAMTAGYDADTARDVIDSLVEEEY